MRHLGGNHYWLVFGIGTLALATLFAFRLAGPDKRIFVPAETSDGHHQIELACAACHSTTFPGKESFQAACEGCHLEALDRARDSHPKAKFTDPRNADRIAVLDARYCTTCHVEHRPAATRAMGVTLPDDFCVLCHAEIADERPTHAGLDFATCGSAGCHNYHDNRALYEDFLLKHGNEPALLATRSVPQRNFASILRYLEAYPKERFPPQPLTAADADAPATGEGAGRTAGPALVADWAATAHAASGVNCSACHEDDSGRWVEHPGYTSCATCHAGEQAAFVLGRHGMRLDVQALGIELPPLRPEDARLPMKDPPIAEHVDCGSCHAPHRFDTKLAAVDACLGCHDDEHSRAYVDSPHALIPDGESSGDGSGHGGSGDRDGRVTCATCHMPRIEQSYDWGAYVHVLVQHNQSDNLRPNEKMARDVCMRCHGLELTLSALADPALIRANFRGAPQATVRSFELAEQRRRDAEREREHRPAEPADPVLPPNQSP